MFYLVVDEAILVVAVAETGVMDALRIVDRRVDFAAFLVAIRARVCNSAVDTRTNPKVIFIGT